MRITFFLLFVTFFEVFAVETSYSQITKVSVEANQLNLSELFTLIEKQSEFLFFYVDADVRNVNVNIKARNTQIDAILSQALQGTDLSYTITNRNINIFRKTDSSQQHLKRVTGNVTDSRGESIIGANVVVKGTVNGTTTDMDGNYSIEVSSSSVLQVSYIGYHTLEILVGDKSKIDIN